MTTTDRSKRTLIERALLVSAFDYTDEVWWRMGEDDRERIDFYVRCSDVFAWGCSDVEEVTEENVGLLEQTVSEGEERLGRYRAYLAFTLFVARVRKERPQDAWYNQVIGTDSDEDAWWRERFDACGPERKQDFGNPHQRKPLRPANPCRFGSGGINPACELPKGHDGPHDPIAL